MAKRTQKRKTKTLKIPASICWFEVPADDLDRAKKFYSSLFGWKFAKSPAAIAEYWHIDTGGKDVTLDGGLMPRLHPSQTITVYVSVPSVDKAVVKVLKLAICEDTDHNTFAVWEMNERAA